MKNDLRSWCAFTGLDEGVEWCEGVGARVWAWVWMWCVCVWVGQIIISI